MAKNYITVAEYARLKGISKQAVYKHKHIIIDAETGLKIIPLSVLPAEDREKALKMFSNDDNANATQTDNANQPGNGDPGKIGSDVDTEVAILREKVEHLSQALDQANTEKERLFNALETLMLTVNGLTQSVNQLQERETRLLSASQEPEQAPGKSFGERVKSIFRRK